MLLSNFKKITIALALSASLSIAQAGIIDFTTSQTQQKIKLISQFPLKSDANLMLTIIEGTYENHPIRQAVLINKADNLLIGISNTFFAQDKQDRDLIRQELGKIVAFNKSSPSQSLVKDAIAKLPKQYIINISSNDKNAKKIYYIISDPTCPHCQNELKNINERLKDGDVKMISIGWLNQQSALRAAKVYANLKDSMSNEEKLKILNDAYNPAIAAPNTNIDKIKEITTSLTGVGKVESVPYIIEVAK